MFRTLLLGSWTVLHVYVFWRAASVPWVRKRLPRRALWPAGALLWAAFFVSRGHGHEGGALLRGLERFGMTWLAALFLTATALLAVDLVTGFGFLLRRAAPRMRGWALVAGALLSAGAFVQGVRPPAVRDHEARLEGLPRELDGKVLAVLSDFHLGTELDGEWLAARVAQVNALRPDAVLLLGDLFEGHGAPGEDLLAPLRHLRAPLGVWGVTGNHESHGRDEDLGMLEAAGVALLRDGWAEAAPGLVLAGVDDLTSRRRAGESADFMGRAVAGRPPGALILLSHSPLQPEKAARAGAGLMLSGHTHGGQVWPFSWLVRLGNPLVAGRYEVGPMTVIVTRGVGTWGPRMRLWHRGEILRITLRAS